MKSNCITLLHSKTMAKTRCNCHLQETMHIRYLHLVLPRVNIKLTSSIIKNLNPFVLLINITIYHHKNENYPWDTLLHHYFCFISDFHLPVHFTIVIVVKKFLSYLLHGHDIVSLRIYHINPSISFIP